MINELKKAIDYRDTKKAERMNLSRIVWKQYLPTFRAIEKEYGERELLEQIELYFYDVPDANWALMILRKKLKDGVLPELGKPAPRPSEDLLELIDDLKQITSAYFAAMADVVSLVKEQYVKLLETGKEVAEAYVINNAPAYATVILLRLDKELTA